MAGNNHVVVRDQNRIAESKTPYALGDLPDLTFRMRARCLNTELINEQGTAHHLMNAYAISIGPQHAGNIWVFSIVLTLELHKP